MIKVSDRARGILPLHSLNLSLSDSWFKSLKLPGSNGFG